MATYTDVERELLLAGLEAKRMALDALERELLGQHQRRAERTVAAETAPPRKRYTMTPAQRKAVSRRMKKMWAAKRLEQK